MADERVVAKDALMVEFGRRGGVGRAKSLTPEQRREIAQRAAQARWAKKVTAPDPTDPKGPKHDEGQTPGIMLSGRRPATSTHSARLRGRSLAAAA